MAEKIFGACEKQYVNCAEHDVRTGTLEERVAQDMAHYHAQRKAKLATLKQKKSVSAVALERVELDFYATLPERQFTKKRNELYAEADAVQKKGRSGSPLRSKGLAITTTRERLTAEMTKQVEREMFLTSTDRKPLEGFKQAVAKVIVKDGTAYPDSNSGWGDSRGSSDYQATLHVRDNCEVAMVENYTESYTWHLYDTFNNDAQTGIKADITCVCGEVFRVPFIVEPDGFGSMMERIMNA